MEFYPCFEEERFEPYLELPMELRLMIIERMEAFDRCRFTQCARSTMNEAKMTKRFAVAVHIEFVSCVYVRALVRYADNYGYWCHGYDTEFELRQDQTLMKCSNVLGVNLWTQELDEMTTLVKHAAEFFQRTVEFYQICIRKLDVMGFYFNHVAAHLPLDIYSFRRMEELVVEDNVDVVQFLRHIPRALKHLECTRNSSVQDLARFDEIYNVTDRFFLPGLRLTNNDFRRICASRIRVHIGNMTPHDIYNFIDTWQSTNKLDHLEMVEWNIHGSGFDERQVFRLLGEGGVSQFNLLWHKGICHHQDPRRTADFISARGYKLAFVINGFYQ